MAIMRSRASTPEAGTVGFEPVSVSFANRTIPEAMASAAAAARGRKPLRSRKEKLPIAEEVDAALVRNLPAGGPTPPAAMAPEAAAPPQPSPPPAVTFDGGVDDGTSIPPDTAGVVNADFVFNPLNNNVHIFDRNGAPVSQLTLDQFWNVFPLPMNAFDPRAVYDPFERRFIFVSTANAERPDSSLLIAVSATDDPTGNWITGFVRVDPAQQGEVWLDYPSVGFTEDKITVQVNLFTLVGNNFAGSSIYVWDKHQLYNPPHTPVVRLFVLTDQGGTQVPAVTHDPGQSTQFLVSRWTGNSNGSGFYNIHEITGSVANGTVALNQVGFLETPGTTWATRASGDFAPQQGTSQRIDAGDDRILSVVCRDGSLWFSHTAFLPAGGPTRTAAQWVQATTNASTLQQLGRVDDPSGGAFFAFPTIAVNGANDALLGFSRFSATTFASCGYALRRAGDPAGQMRTPHVYGPGGSTYFKTFGGTDNRWGDYSNTQVDPVDDRSFWTVQERASATQNFWATQWA
ncbi:MAG TPA: hypothetical protein VLE27_01865, partial [Thermoanaerobaculia bacterium]|nr:hypothetical protein [Thermoanaerobaculia bacterium]